MVTVRHGKRASFTLGPQSTPDPQSGAYWSVLVPAGAHAGRWPHVLDNVVQRPALYKEPVDFDSEWMGDGGKVFYARLYERGSRSGPSLEEKLMVSLQDQVVARKPKYVIVDLRLNTGGNFMKTIVWLEPVDLKFKHVAIVLLRTFNVRSWQFWYGSCERHDRTASGSRPSW